MESPPQHPEQQRLDTEISLDEDRKRAVEIEEEMQDMANANQVLARIDTSDTTGTGSAARYTGDISLTRPASSITSLAPSISDQPIIMCIGCRINKRRCDSGEPCRACIDSKIYCKRAMAENWVVDEPAYQNSAMEEEVTKMKGETMVMDGQAAVVINKNAQVVKEIARLTKYKARLVEDKARLVKDNARLEKEVAQLKKDKAQRVVDQSQRVGENAILAENADGAVAEVARLRSELETLKAKLADKNAGKKRDRDEILEHHDPAPSTPYVHKKTRRAGVRHAYSVSQPNYHTEA
jgi:hypothetical protein